MKVPKLGGGGMGVVYKSSVEPHDNAGIDLPSVGPNYCGVSPRFASSCTDFVVADLSIFDLVGRPQAGGGFVICLANTR